MSAVVHRGDADVRGENRFFDRGERAFVPRLDHEQPRFRRVDAGELLQAGRGAVILDHDVFDQRRRGFPCADGVKAVDEGLFGLHHVLFEFVKKIGRIQLHGFSPGFVLLFPSLRKIASFPAKCK